MLNSVNHPERATSRPAFAVPGAEFSCAAIVKALYTERKDLVDRCKRVLAESVLGRVEATEAAVHNVLESASLYATKNTEISGGGAAGQPTALDLISESRIYCGG